MNNIFKGTKGKWVVNKNVIIADDEFETDIFNASDHYNDEVTKANLLLISKAPEMLEMLISVKEHLNDDDKWSVEQLIKRATEL